MLPGPRRPHVTGRDPDLLTTGEAAALLGVSRQHIADLCDEGVLEHGWAGTHRRVSRHDVEALAAGSRQMTPDQQRSLLLAHAVAAHVVTDPEGTRALARRNLQLMRAAGAHQGARVWLDQWDALLDGPVLDLLAALTSPSPRSRELRQNTPFAGVLSSEERRRIIDASRAARTA